MRDPKADILIRVYLLYTIMLLFGMAIIARIAFIQFKLGDELLLKAQQQELRIFNIEATRGNILSDDGLLLATSVPVFEIRMDVASPLIDDPYFNSRVDSLAQKLSILFRNKTKERYANELKRARQKGNRYLLIRNHVSYAELQKLRTFPIFERGKFRGGLIAIPSEKREKPFNELASRTLGYENSRENLFVGIEGAYHHILKGVDGKQLKRRINNGDWKPIFDHNEVESQNGKDVMTTIDVNLQDVAESALRRNLTENKAYQGCAILMEVETGFIKAIANLTYDSVNHIYRETYNYAIAESVEPGSTFKLASFMALLEDKKIRLSDSMYIDRSATYHRRTMRDVYPIRDGHITVREAFEKSSNVATAKLVYDAYQDNPEKFVDRILAMMLGNPLNISIPGEGRPYIKHPSDKKNWYGTSLPWMSIGYESQLTPLQILTFYNAVANNGQMVKPQFVKEIRQGGLSLETIRPEIISKSIASKSTIDTVRSLMEGVVQSGTARQLRNSAFRIAGKTGTAQIALGNKGYNKQNYNASFVGYFPANKPKYSCIVVVNNPSTGKIYGGAVAAPVFKEIADKVYATRLDIHDGFHRDENLLAELPTPPNITYYDDLSQLYKQLGYATEDFTDGELWASLVNNGGSVQLEGIEVEPSGVPNVIGMNARDAIYILENLGLHTSISGRGKVYHQSVNPRSPIIKGELIELRLRSL